MNELEALRLAIERERRARADAERLLEDKSREMFALNQDLLAARAALERRVVAADEATELVLRQLRLAMESASLGSWTFDRERGAMIQDSAAAQMSGAPEAICEPIDAWLLRLHPDDRAPTEAALRAGEARALELDCRSPHDGGLRALRLWGQADAGAKRISGVMRDVTEERRRQVAARQTFDERQRIERLSLLGELASSIAHEVNQPLGSIANYSALALRLLPDSEQGDLRDALVQIGLLSRRASDIIRNLRSLISKPEVRVETCDLAAVAATALSLLGRAAEDSGARIERSLPPVPTACNRILIEQAIMNLVRNAIEAMRRSPERVATVAVREDGGDAIIEVSDTGPGLQSIDEHAIFAPLVTTKSGGTGMGLALCRTIAETHGGSIICARNPNHPTGLRFELRLPRAST